MVSTRRTLTLVPTVQEQPYCIFLAVSTNPGVLYYVSQEIERLSAANILFPVQRQRESQGRICAKITDLLSYFCVLPTKEHLHSKGPGTIRTACTAQTVNLGWLSSTIQCGWRKRKKKSENGTRTSFFTIRFTSRLHCLWSETVHRLRAPLFKPTSLILFI